MTMKPTLLLLLALCSGSFAEDGTPKKFEQTLSLQGISFTVSSPNKGSLNQVTIQPEGLETENDTIKVEADGTVTGAEVADLDADGSPEIYVYVQSAGSGSYASLIGYAANKRKSLSAIYLPELSDDPKNSKGYMGHDRFAVVENRLVRRFPLYQELDSNSKPSGKTRQLQYRLTPGEAGWILKLDKALEY